MQGTKKTQLADQKAAIEKEIELTNKLLEETRNKKNNTLHELSLITTKIQKRNQLIEEINHKIERLEKQISENSITLKLLEAELIKSKQQYADLIYFAFRNSSDELNIMYLIASKDVNQLYSRYKYLQQYTEYRKRQVKIIITLKGVIEKKLMELEGKKASLLSLVNERLAERSSLFNDSEETEKLTKLLKQKEDTFREELEEKRKLARKLEKEIEDLIKAETKKGTFNKLTAEEKIILSDFEKNKGKLPWPTKQGVITEKFGEHSHQLVHNVMVERGGIDISTVENSEVFSIFEGEVAKIFQIKGQKFTIMLKHGKYYSVYHNVVDLRVKMGDKVKYGQVLGNVYTDITSGQSILQFQIWKELNKQNPEDWIRN